MTVNHSMMPKHKPQYSFKVLTDSEPVPQPFFFLNVFSILNYQLHTSLSLQLSNTSLNLLPIVVKKEILRPMKKSKM